MKSKIKYLILTSLMAVLLFCTAISVNAAESGKCGKNLTYMLDDSGTLTISGTGDMYDYTSQAYTPWRSTRSAIKSIIIDNCVTSVGKYAFYDCANLTNVTMTDSVTSIGDYAFYKCTGLTSITIPKSVTSIGGYAFYKCTSLTNITIPSSVTSIGKQAFYGCTGLIKIYWNAKNVADFNNSGVFSYAGQKGTGIDVVFGENVETIPHGAFYTTERNGAPKIVSVTIGNSVTFIGCSAFSGCTGLTSITIPDSVASIGDYAFSGCTGLKSITIPNSVTSIGDYAFRGCTGLTSITIPDSVTSINYWTFLECTNLTNINVSNENKYYSSIDGNVYNKEKTSILICAPGKSDVTISDGVSSIGERAFFYCTGLTSVTIPNSVTSIGSSAFFYCTGLTSITLPNSVTSIGDNAFNSCTGLTSLNIPDNVVSIGECAFGGCKGLTKIYWNAKNVADFIVDMGAVFSYAGQKNNGIDVVFGENVEAIPYGAFSAFSDDDAPKIVSVTIPNSVTSIGERAFFYCTDLTSISIPDSVTSIGERAFFGCTGLKNVTMSKSIEKIGYQAFNETALSNDENNLENGVLYIGNALVYAKNLTNSEYTIKSDTRCIADYTLVSENLKSINVDSNNKYYSSVDGVLYNKEKTTLIQYPCGNEKKDFSIPDGVTSVGNYAFYNCTGLTSITIPNSVTSIGDDAFDYCNGLKKIYITDLAAWCNIEYKSYCSQPLSNYGCSLYINGEIATDITIPNSVTSIDDYAFYGCKNLTSITIPDSVTSIGECAFCGCSELSTVYFIGTESEWKNIYIGSYNDYLTNATIIYITIYTFETNGGSAVSSVTNEVTESPVTTCEGKIFLGWYDNAEFSGTAITFPYSGEKTTLYAKWGAKITYTGDLDSEQTVDCGSNALLPTAPEGYVYKFTANGEEWDGTNITSDVTVTVTKLCDKCEVVEIGDCYDIAANGDTLNISTYFGKIFCDEISVSESANVKVYSNENYTGDSLEYINITGNSAVVYIVVTAESGRTQTYKAQFLRTAVDLGQIEYTDDRDGLIILKLKKTAPGEPKFYIAYSKDGTNYTYAEAEYNPEKLSIQLSGFEGQTKYFVKVAADYRLCSGEYAESNVIEILTEKIVSSACEITKIISPASAVFNQETRTITAKVANAFSEYQINVEVSEGATWGVYRTESAQIPLEENKLKLNEGKTTTAFIRVVAEDGTNKLYTIKIYRQKKSALPEISYTDGKVTITAPEGSTILYTTDNKTPIPGVYGNAYTGTFTAEIGSIVKAIALNPDAEEYSEVAIFRVADDTEITAETVYVYVSGTNVDFEYYLQTSDQTNLNGTFYLAAYNDDDVLVGLYTEEVKKDTAEYDLSGAMTVSETPAYFKAFFWGGESGMKPLRNNVTKDKEN